MKNIFAIHHSISLRYSVRPPTKWGSSAYCFQFSNHVVASWLYLTTIIIWWMIIDTSKGHKTARYNTRQIWRKLDTLFLVCKIGYSMWKGKVWWGDLYTHIHKHTHVFPQIVLPLARYRCWKAELIVFNANHKIWCLNESIWILDSMFKLTDVFQSAGDPAMACFSLLCNNMGIMWFGWSVAGCNL